MIGRPFGATILDEQNGSKRILGKQNGGKKIFKDSLYDSGPQ